MYLKVTDKQLLKMIKQLIDMPSLKLQKIDYSDSIIRIYASIKSRRSKCPHCGIYSKRVHDYYFRTITDLPVFQNRTVILLKTRKFRCGNDRCHRKVFSEQTPGILRYSRRTRRTCWKTENVGGWVMPHAGSPSQCPNRQDAGLI